MIKGKIFIDKRRKSKNGFPVKIIISGYGMRKMISAGMHSGQIGFNRSLTLRKAELIKQVEYCNDQRFDFEEAVRYIESGGEAELSILKEKIRQLEGASLVYPFWDSFIEEMQVAGKSTRMMAQSKDQIETFTHKLYFSDITYEWISKFIAYKYREGCGPAGVSAYLRCLRTVYLEAQRRESVNTPAGNPFRGIIPKGRKKPPVQIAKSDLARITGYVPRKGTTEKNASNLQRRLSIFLFQIYIGGHDLIDVSRLKWKDVKGGRVRFTRHKNRNRETVLIDNVLTPEALEVIEKYGTPELERVFAWIPITEESYRNYTGHTRRALKIVCEDLDLPKLTTKSPRYIFKTWAGQAGVNFEVVMQIMGHKGSAVPFGYQGRFPNDMVDQVLKTVLKV